MCDTSWQHFPHGADMGVRGIGKSKAAAFEQAALALTALVSDPRSVRADILVKLECQAPDDELLLVEWLNGIIYEMATRKMLFARFAVAIDGNRLNDHVAANPRRTMGEMWIEGARGVLRLDGDARLWWKAKACSTLEPVCPEVRRVPSKAHRSCPVARQQHGPM